MNKITSKFLACMALVCASSLHTAGQGTLYTIVSNGPPSARFNMVILSEGYTSAELPTFRSDATNALNGIFSREPWKEYRPYCNTYAIAVASLESGTDHPGWQSVDTYFNSSYDESERLITIPLGATGQGRVDALIASLIPDCDAAILLVNDPFGGGSEGSGKTAIASVFGVPDVLVHELGHVIAGLGDEYADAVGSYPDIEEPNTTRETNRASIKWRAWIAPETPVPTPPGTEYADVIGLFEGAHYHNTGWYRPRQNCTMQSQLTPEFCEVCREALAIATWKRVNRISSFLPASSTLLVTATSAVPFSVTLLDPATHNLQAQWYLDNQPVPGATARLFNLLPSALQNGNHTISVIATDPTLFVRTDPGNSRSTTNTWTVTINLPAESALRIDSIQSLPDSRVRLQVSGTAPQGFVVETSSNLSGWVPKSTNSLANGTCSITDDTSGTRSFYRLRTPP